jgi:hypothetical protein
MIVLVSFIVFVRFIGRKLTRPVFLDSYFMILIVSEGNKESFFFFLNHGLEKVHV